MTLLVRDPFHGRDEDYSVPTRAEAEQDWRETDRSLPRPADCPYCGQPELCGACLDDPAGWGQ